MRCTTSTKPLSANKRSTTPGAPSAKIPGCPGAGGHLAGVAQQNLHGLCHKWIRSRRGEDHDRDLASRFKGAGTRKRSSMDSYLVLGRLAQHIAAAPHRLDVVLAVGGVGQLLAQLADEDVDDF